jgi:hypothetical protein
VGLIGGHDSKFHDLPSLSAKPRRGPSFHFFVADPRQALNFQLTLDGADKARLVYFRANGEALELQLTKVSQDENDADIAH